MVKVKAKAISAKRKREMEGETQNTTPMEDNSLDIDELAKFAIEEHNKKQNAMLEFKKIVHVKDQVVAGKMYYITIETTNAGNNKDYHYYEAKVWVKPWLNFKELQDFKYVGSTPDDGTVL